MTRRHFAAYSWTLLALLIGVILWGAYVRATGSGAGCGSHWPLCNGEVIPLSEQAETLIEFTHRVTSGLALLGGVGLVWLAFRLFSAGSLVRRAAVATLLLLVVEALIGAGIVLFGLVADDDSAARATVMALHLVNTFLLLASATVTSLAASGIEPRRQPWLARPRLMILLALGAIVIVAASGAVTALGDTLFAGSSPLVAEAGANGGHFLVQLRIFHPMLALLAAGLTLIACGQVRGLADYRVRLLSAAVVGLVLAQTLAGLVNVWLRAPVWLQIIHLLLADLLWIALVALLLVVAVHPARPTRSQAGG